MTPIFGRGVVFDGTPEQRLQAMRNQRARQDDARTPRRSRPRRRMMAGLATGEIDLLDFFSNSRSTRRARA
jgi:sterol 14-demethylase